MTVGSKTIGSPDGDFYFVKSWSGSDGRQNRSNPWTCNITIETKSKSQMRDYDWSPCSGAYDYRFKCDSSSTLPAPWDDNADLALIGKLGQAVRGHNFNLGVFAAESRELVSASVGAVQSFSKAIRSLKRGNLDGALRELSRVTSADRRHAQKQLDRGDVHGTWLALQLGWLPTISDVYEAGKAFERLTSPPRRTKVVATVMRKESYNGSMSPSQFSCDGYVKESRRMHTYLTEQLSASRSLGLLDPLPVLWEAAPLSFVFDWFLPIGSYLEALAAIPILGRETFVTRRYERYNQLKTVYSGNYLGCGGSYTLKKLTFQRWAVSPVSAPLPNFTGIGAYSGKRLLTAIALASARIA